MSEFTERLKDGAKSILDKANELQERIRHRAHAIWEREGRPHGRDAEHWRKAESEIAGEDAEPETGKGRAKKATVSARSGAKKSAPLAAAATADEGAAATKPSKRSKREPEGKEAASATMPRKATSKKRKE